MDLSHVPPTSLLAVEADIYWCLSKLLDSIQDHYTPSQPGIQRMTFRMRELVHRIDGACAVYVCLSPLRLLRYIPCNVAIY